VTEDEPKEEEEEESKAEWQVKGPATPQQAILAIGLIFFVGFVLGFLMCRAF
jgi:hypothetical protein